eukprot:3560864-Amphidinium_carterae.2
MSSCYSNHLRRPTRPIWDLDNPSLSTRHVCAALWGARSLLEHQCCTILDTAHVSLKQLFCTAAAPCDSKFKLAKWTIAAKGRVARYVDASPASGEMPAQQFPRREMYGNVARGCL